MSTAAEPGEERLRVVASISPVRNIVYNIGGDRIELDGIMPPGVDPHTFEPRPSDAVKLSQADLIFVNGLHLDETTLRLAQANLKEGAEIVQLAVATAHPDELIYGMEHHHGHAEDDDHEDEDEHGHAEDDDHEDEDEHGHAEDDDHEDEDEHGHAEDDDHDEDEDEHGHAEDDDHDEDEDEHGHAEDDDHEDEDEHGHAEDNDHAEDEDEHGHAEDDDDHEDEDEHGHAEDDDHDEDEDEHGHAEDDDDHEDEDEHGHDEEEGEEGEPDPHLLLDPNFAIRYAKVIFVSLSSHDPDNREYYEDNLNEFTARLIALDEAIRATTATIPESNRRLLTYHDSFGYFALRYGYTVIGAIQPNDTSEPSAQEVAALIDQLLAEEVPAIFGSILFPADVIEQIARETGATVSTLLDDGLPGEPGDPEHTYIGMMVENLRTLATVLGGDPSLMDGVETGNVPDRQ